MSIIFASSFGSAGDPRIDFADLVPIRHDCCRDPGRVVCVKVGNGELSAPPSAQLDDNAGRIRLN